MLGVYREKWQAAGMNSAECGAGPGVANLGNRSGSSLWGFGWWPEAHGVGRESSLCGLWWQGMGVFSVGQKTWLDPFGGPGQGRVKASVVSVKQPACED